jgi:hypothetical protein
MFLHNQYALKRYDKNKAGIKFFCFNNCFDSQNGMVTIIGKIFSNLKQLFANNENSLTSYNPCRSDLFFNIWILNY